MSNKNIKKTIHKMKLSEPWYRLVKENHKNYEARLLDEKRKLLKVGDYIEFSDSKGNNTFIKEIEKLSIHKSFENAIKKGGLNKVLPGIKTIHEGVNSVYYSIPGYKEKEKDLKVILIKFKNK